MGLLRNRRRKALMARALEPEWVALIEETVPYYVILPQDQRRELEGLLQVFLDEKRFEGCGGFEITDEVRFTVAGHACMLLLGRETDFYPLLDSVLVYPDSYVAPTRHYHPGGTVSEGDEVRSGESWAAGSVVLSWEDVIADVDTIAGGYNVVLHEFAHQLDAEHPDAEGVPVLPDRSMYPAWASVFTREYETLVTATERGEEPFLDPYGAESPAEFFAVATETFFTLPLDLETQHPDLYTQLRALFGQDPAALCRAAGIDAP